MAQQAATNSSSPTFSTNPPQNPPTASLSLPSSCSPTPSKKKSISKKKPTKKKPLPSASPPSTFKDGGAEDQTVGGVSPSTSPPASPPVSPISPLVSPPTSPAMSPANSPIPSPALLPSSSQSSSSLSLPGFVSSVEAQEMRIEKERISSAEDHPFLCVTVVDKGSNMLLAFNCHKNRLDIYRHPIKTQKDLLSLSSLSPSECFEFPSITSFSFEFVKEKEKEKEKGKEKEKEKEKVKEKEKEKEKARGGSTAALPETKGILYSDSNVLSQFKLMHISQQEPLSDILRIITEGGDPSSYFRTRSALCIKKGLIPLRLKKEERKFHVVLTVKTVSVYLNQIDTIPVLSIPLPVCELRKMDKEMGKEKGDGGKEKVGEGEKVEKVEKVEKEEEKGEKAEKVEKAEKGEKGEKGEKTEKEKGERGVERMLVLSVVGMGGITPIQMVFKTEYEREIWYSAMRKATRIQPWEVGTVIELQNDIVAHFGLPPTKSKIPCMSLLSKQWSFLNADEPFDEDNYHSPHWKILGFQNEDPLVDMKRVGILGLRHLSYYCERWPEIISSKIAIAKDDRLAETSYKLATVGVLVTDLLTSLVGLHPNREGLVAKFPASYPMFFHNSLNPKMFDELFCWGMHVFDLLWEDYPKTGRRVEGVMAILKEKMGKKLRQLPVHGGFEYLFSEESKALKGKIEKTKNLLETKTVLVELYPELVYHLIKSDMYLAFAINQASPHSMSMGLSDRMTKMLELNDCYNPGLLSLLQLEINATLTGTTLFRENNICTYMLTSYTKLLAERSGFLKKVIYPVVVELCSSGKSFDFSGRGKESPEQIQENLSNVLFFVQKIFENIINSFEVMPVEFYWISHVLQTTVLEKFPECKHSIVGSFLFLRLLCPLIVTPPSHWEDIPSPIPPKEKKGLVLVSKILQNMSNGTFLREQNTESVNSWLKDNKKRLEDFFDTLGSAPSDLPQAPQPPAGLSPKNVKINFDDALHIHSFLHSHLLQVDEAIRTQLPCGIDQLQDLAALLAKLPSGIEPFLEGIQLQEKKTKK